MSHYHNPLIAMELTPQEIIGDIDTRLEGESLQDKLTKAFGVRGAEQALKTIEDNQGQVDRSMLLEITQRTLAHGGIEMGPDEGEALKKILEEYL